MAISNFLVIANNTIGPGWSIVATVGNSIWLNNLMQLSLHLSFLCGSWLILNLKTEMWKNVGTIAVPRKRGHL